MGGQRRGCLRTHPNKRSDRNVRGQHHLRAWRSICIGVITNSKHCRMLVNDGRISIVLQKVCRIWLDNKSCPARKERWSVDGVGTDSISASFWSRSPRNVSLASMHPAYPCAGDPKMSALSTTRASVVKTIKTCQSRPASQEDPSPIAPPSILPTKRKRKRKRQINIRER